MATYSDSEAPRHRRERRPRYVEESDSDDGYPPRRHEPRRSRPPYPASSNQEMPAKPSRRRSILIDPDETASQKDQRRRVRSKSNVRLQTSSDDETEYRRSGRPPGEPRATRRDLERKNSHEDMRFRQKRDGYESDEGATLRRSRSAREPARSRKKAYDEDPPYYNYEPNPYQGETMRPPKAGADAATSLPMRSKRRDPVDQHPPPPPPVAYGAVPFPAGAPEPPPAAPSRTADYARDTMPARRDQARGDFYDPYAAGPPPRRDGHSRRHHDHEEDHGYRSEGPSRRRHQPDNRDYDDYYDRRRRDEDYRAGGERRAPRPRPEDYYSDHREDRTRRYDRDGRGERDRYRDYDYDRGGRRRDYDRPKARYDERDRDRSKKKKSPDWQKEAGALFTTYAMPVIRQEGTKLFKDQMQKYLAKRQAGQV